jgi:hypothetical protein
MGDLNKFKKYYNLQRYRFLSIPQGENFVIWIFYDLTFRVLVRRQCGGFVFFVVSRAPWNASVLYSTGVINGFYFFRLCAMRYAYALYRSPLF